MVEPQVDTLEELKEWLINVHEKYYIELKKANELPNAFWESYSAFSNTDGGWIILGVVENKPQNEITGVGNVDKTIVSLWDQLSNKNKVSYRTIDNTDVNTYEIDGKKVIIVHVKEAPETVKPVYLNGKLENSWIRTGDGDRKVTPDELGILLRNANPAYDDLPAEKFTMEDLDMDSVITYKERVHKRYPKKKYIEMTPETFLKEIGACTIDRNTGEFQIKRGALLFLGKVNAIKELFPHYHVDFFDRRGKNERWIDRVTDDEPSDYEMNLYNFYIVTYEKLKALLKEAFSLDEYQLRIPFSDFDETIRECLVNCLAHADYVQGYPSTKIDVFNGWFRFVNPGKMLVSKEQFLMGGDSRPRNEIIMKMFRLLGASERQGFGGPLIYKTALENDFRSPEIITDIEHTELRVWNIDLADSYPEFTDDEKAVLRCIVKQKNAQSVNDIREKLNFTDYRVRKIITMLLDNHLVEKEGNGSATKYVVARQSVEKLTQLQIKMEKMKQDLV